MSLKGIHWKSQRMKPGRRIGVTGCSESQSFGHQERASDTPSVAEEMANPHPLTYRNGISLGYECRWAKVPGESADLFS